MSLKFPPVNRYSRQPGNVLEWRAVAAVGVAQAWKPRPLDHASWPPNYRAVYAWRLETMATLNASPALVESAMAYYEHRPAEFIMHWMDTYDPRKAIKWMPFVLFERQDDLIAFLEECIADSENGLVEKCRDFGATWIVCAYIIHCWLFIKNDAIGIGSRKQELVDKLGDASSIFEKLRLLIRRLPWFFKPRGLKEREHMTFMKLINPENGAVVTGETGDNIGRGGRTRWYLKDESAHYERPELIEAALGDNTNCQIDVSSVNGLGNVFHRKREAGIDWQRNANITIQPGYTRVFVADYSHHPEKDKNWFNIRRDKAAREGMLHVFAQEVERNYSAAVSNTIIPYEYLEACVDAHLTWNIDQTKISNTWIAGLDVADEGIDQNACAIRQWVILRSVSEWGERDPGVTTRKTINAIRDLRATMGVRTKIRCMYDSIGIGSSVKSEYNRLVDLFIESNGTDGIDPQLIEFIGWNAGAKVQNPNYHVIPDDEESALNGDFFHNMKAQAWWSLRTRCFKTWKMRTDPTSKYDLDELISFDGRIPAVIDKTLLKQLAQPTHRPSASSLKMVVEKKPDGTKSPNMGDGVIESYFPLDTEGVALVGAYGF